MTAYRFDSTLRLIALALSVTAACAGSAVNLDTREIASDEGAVVGRILVRSKRLDVSGNCSVIFKNRRDEQVTRVPLKPDSWVFMTLREPG